LPVGTPQTRVVSGNRRVAPRQAPSFLSCGNKKEAKNAFPCGGHAVAGSRRFFWNAVRISLLDLRGKGCYFGLYRTSVRFCISGDLPEGLPVKGGNPEPFRNIVNRDNGGAFPDLSRPLESNLSRGNWPHFPSR
jgi:hypothetical protein